MLGASRHGLDLEMLMRKIIALTTVVAVLGTASLAYAGCGRNVIHAAGPPPVPEAM